MRAVPILSSEHLAGLEERWRRQKAPVAANLRPGLAAAEIEKLTHPLELSLPLEARIWWGWHDGADIGPNRMAVSRMIGPLLEFLPLKDAVASYEVGRQIRAKAHGEEAVDEWWRPEWFPFTARRGEIVCDCSVGDGDATPIRALDPQSPPEAVGEILASSMGELVGWWCEALEDGAWRFDTERGVWDYDWEAIDALGRGMIV
jgi:cell wall assembly regulator SMI1